MVNFPINLDTDTELYLVTDGVDDVLSAHHNALKDAVKNIEEKVGIDSSAVVTTIDYILNTTRIKG